MDSNSVDHRCDLFNAGTHDLVAQQLQRHAATHLRNHRRHRTSRPSHESVHEREHERDIDHHDCVSVAFRRCLIQCAEAFDRFAAVEVVFIGSAAGSGSSSSP